MFCNQCEETARGCACTARGVCGKDPETAGLQDVLIWVCRGSHPRNLAAGEGGTRTSGCSSRGRSSAPSRTSTSTPTASGTLSARPSRSATSCLPRTGEPAANAWVPTDDAAMGEGRRDCGRRGDRRRHPLPPDAPPGRAQGARGLLLPRGLARVHGRDRDRVPSAGPGRRSPPAHGRRARRARHGVRVGRGHDPRPSRPGEHRDLRPPRNYDRPDHGRRPAGDPRDRARARRPQAAPRPDPRERD